MGSCWSSLRLSLVRLSILSFLDDNKRKCQLVFTKLSMCIDIVEIGLGLLMDKFCQFLTELSARHTSIFAFPNDSLNKIN